LPNAAPAPDPYFDDQTALEVLLPTIHKKAAGLYIKLHGNFSRILLDPKTKGGDIDSQEKILGWGLRSIKP
jgi:hypothetical protein